MNRFNTKNNEDRGQVDNWTRTSSMNHRAMYYVFKYQQTINNFGFVDVFVSVTSKLQVKSWNMINDREIIGWNM